MEYVVRMISGTVIYEDVVRMPSQTINVVRMERIVPMMEMNVAL